MIDLNKTVKGYREKHVQEILVEFDNPDGIPDEAIHEHMAGRRFDLKCGSGRTVDNMVFSRVEGSGSGKVELVFGMYDYSGTNDTVKAEGRSSMP